MKTLYGALAVASCLFLGLIAHNLTLVQRQLTLANCIEMMRVGVRCPALERGRWER